MTHDALLANPYVGPRTFSYEQRHLFFGREREARDLLARVLSERLLLFYAQSGAGKSSLINTRLIPSLQEKDFVVLPVARVSGELPAGVERVDNIFAFNLMLGIVEDCDPAQLANVTLSDFLARLARRTVVGGNGQERKIWLYDAAQAPAAGGSQRYTLIVDQFEEIITAHPGRWHEREAFFRQLDAAMQADSNLWVVLTLREDYVAALDPYAPLLADRLRARYLMQHMKAEAALEAVRRPAELAGLPFAPGVAEKLVDDLRQIRVPGQENTVAGETVQAVQLEVVCFQLWEELSKGQATEGEEGKEVQQITLENLAAAGDVNRALTQFYEETLAAALADPAAEGVSERQLRTWFDQELITPAGTRGLVIQSAAGAGGLPNGVVDALQRSFLVHAETRGGDAWIELVHDRFVEPIRASNAAWFPMHLSPLQRQAALWDEQRRADGLLLSGEALVEAELWAEAQPQALEPNELDFLAACRQAKERQLREQRQKRRIQILALAAVAGMVLALVLAVLAWQKTSEANNKAKQVRASQLAAQSQEVAERSPQLAVLLAIASLDEAKAAGEEDFPESVQSLRSSLANISGRPLPAQPSEPTNWALSPDQRWFVAGGGDRAVLAWDLTSEQLQPQRLAGSTYLPSEPFSPDSRWLALGHEDGAVLWDLQAAEPISRTLGGFVNDYGVARFSPNSRWLVGGNEDGSILWDLQATELISNALDSFVDVYGASPFSTDSRWLVSRDEDRSILWNLQATELISNTLDSFVDVYGASPFSTDSRWLVSRDEDRSILWDLQTTKPTSTPLEGFVNLYDASPFSTDSRWLVSSDEDRSILWELQATGPISRLLDGFVDVYGASSFSTDSRWLVSNYVDGSILWDLQRSPPTSNTLDGFVNMDGVSPFSPDSRWLVVSRQAEDGVSKQSLLGLKAEDPVTTLLEPCDGQSSRSFSTSGLRLACLDAEGNVHVWDLEKPEQEPDKLMGDQIEQLRFSPDEKWLVATRTDHGLNVWHLDEETNLRVMRGYDSDIADVRFLDDGLTMVTISQDGDLRLWDLQSVRDMPLQLPGHDGKVVALAFDENNSRIVSVDDADEALSWDLTQQEPDPTRLYATGFDQPSGFISTDSPIAVSPQGRFLASSNGPEVSIYDVQQGTSSGCNLSNIRSMIRAFFFSPNGGWLAAAESGDDPQLHICDTAARGNQEARLVSLKRTPAPDQNRRSEIDKWAISSDGRWLATANNTANAGRVELGEIGSGQVRLQSIPELTGKPIVALAFSPDGSVLAVAAENKVTLWPTGETAEPVIFDSEDRVVSSIAFNATGTLLAVGHDDGTIDVRNMHTMDAEPEPWLLPKTAIRSLAFSTVDNGRWLAAGGEDGSIHIIDRTQNDQALLRDRACKTVGRNLSLSEWKQYIETDALEGDYQTVCTDWSPHPSAVDAMVQDGDQFAGEGDLLSAERLYDEARQLDDTLTIDPAKRARQTLAWSTYYDGRNLAKQGDLEGAIAKFRQAMEQNPDLAIEPETVAKRIYADSLFQDAEALAKEGDLDEAIGKYRQAMEYDPDLTVEPETEAKRVYAAKLIEQAEALAKEGDLDGAIAEYRQAMEYAIDLAIEPEIEARRIFWPHLIEQVGSLVEQGDMAGAVAKVEKYLPFYPNVTLAPDSLVSRIYASRVVQQARDLANAGKKDEAAAHWEQVFPLVMARPLNANSPVTGTVISLLGDFYTFEGTAGQVLTIDMEQDNSDLDAYLTVLGPGFFEMDDDSGPSLNSRIGSIDLPADGVYLVVASGYDVSEGAYRLRLNTQPATAQ